MSKKPISCTSPPNRLHVSPWANSCPAVTTNTAIQARSRFSTRHSPDMSRRIAAWLAAVRTRAQAMVVAEMTMKYGVKKNPSLPIIRFSSRS